jgi:hypothetical protein
VARTIPCLDLHFPSLGDQPDLPDLVSLALYDLSPAAIHETGDDRVPVWRIFLSDPARVDAAARQLAARFDGNRSSESRAWKSTTRTGPPGRRRTSRASPWDASPWRRHGMPPRKRRRPW